MLTSREHIAIVWLKRDLRLQDNEAIYNAFKSGKRVLLLYVFENILISDPHYSERHWNFIKESIVDLNKRLKSYNSKILAVNSDVIPTFNKILSKYQVSQVFSHQETGILTTYERDKNFKRFCRNNLIEWHENINNGVKRGLKNRDNWFDNWSAYMANNILDFNPIQNQLITTSEIKELETLFTIANLKPINDSPFQKGGTTMAYRYANSFFKSRHHKYAFNISKPHESRESCSRLSPYIAWGNVSVREIYQKAQESKKHSKSIKHLSNFASRLRWQAHFIQKFEMEHTMEKASINKGYHKLKKSISKTYQKAWQEGKTGFPLVDASMRCLNQTGYINFRMRAMLVSFFAHILWQPWQDTTVHLSSMFLDFEPGIHFPQLQMQAGESGINTVRIYNPIKNGIEHDPEAKFIKKWVPELSHLKTHFVHEPYLMTELEQRLYNLKLGVDYPKPIVDLKANRKHASDILWNMKKNSIVQYENTRIIAKHTIKRRSKMFKSD